jgi:hypothetical protein
MVDGPVEQVAQSVFLPDIIVANTQLAIEVSREQW